MPPLKVFHPALVLLLLALLLRPAVARAQAHPDAPTLADFLALAYQSSPLLFDYATQVRQNQVDSLRRAAQQRPQVTGVGSAIYAPILKRNANGEGGFGYDEAVSNGGNYGSFASVTQPVFNRPVLANDYAVLNSQGLVIRNIRQRATLDLRRTVTDQFLVAYAAQQLWGFQGGLLRQLNEQDALLRRLVNAGIFKQTQYLAFYASLQTQKVNVQQARLNYRRELGTLRYQAGAADTALVELAAPAPPPPRPLAGLNSITQRQYTLDSLRLRLDRTAVDLLYRPRLSWVADAGLQSASPALGLLTHNFGVSGGLALTLPIFDGHQRQLGYERIRLGEQSRLNYRRYLTTQRQQQYGQLQALAREATALLVTIREQTRIAGALVEAGRQQLGTGDLAILDYLALVTNYRSLQLSLTQAETERLRSLYALDYLAE